MSMLWKWIDEKNMNKEAKVRLFLFLNSLLFCVMGFVAWIIVSQFAFSSLAWAFCFVGYPGFFIGYIGGFIFLGRH